MKKEKITIDDIAKELGCSKSTVSRALSGKGRIGDEMRKKVLSCCEKNGYKPNVIAASLAKSKTYNLGVVIPADENINTIPFFQNCLMGVCEISNHLGYDVVVITIDAQDISQLEGLVEKKKVDAVILTRALVDDHAVAYLRKQTLPFILVGGSAHADILKLDSPHVEACRELTSTLIEKGIRKLALIGGNMQHVVSQKRYQGFEEGFQKNGMSVQKNLVYLNCNTNTAVEQAVESALREGAECLLCMDDRICMQVLPKLARERIVIPRNLKVASMYDSFFLQNYHPAVTSIHFADKELGREACRRIVDKLEGRDQTEEVSIGYHIVLRESTSIRTY